MTSPAALFTTDAVGVGNTTVFVDVTTRTNNTTAGPQTEINDVKTMTSLTFTGISTYGVVTSTSMSSQTFG